MKKMPKIVVIVGPTASGKTALSLDLAEKFDGEIVNADSRQVYRGMNIGTAKAPKDPGSKYTVGGVVHHLIDIVDPDDEFTLAHFKQDAFTAIDDILSRGKLPILVGGTGLYVQAIIDNLDIPAVEPDLQLRARLETMSADELAEMLKDKDAAVFARIDRHNPRRLIRALEVAMAENLENIEKDHKLPPRYEALQIGLEVPRAELIKRIETRVDEQIKSGLVNEVKELSKKYTWSLPAMSGIGYKQIGYYLRGELSLAEAVDLIKRDTRRYAKRQMTWFRRDKRIKWVAEPAQAEPLVRQYIKKTTD